MTITVQNLSSVARYITHTHTHTKYANITRMAAVAYIGTSQVPCTSDFSHCISSWTSPLLGNVLNNAIGFFIGLTKPAKLI
jgi:hypothetical protein